MKNSLNVDIKYKKNYSFGFINSGFKMIDYISVENTENVSHSDLEIRIRSNPEYLYGNEKLSYINPFGFRTVSSDFIKIDFDKIKNTASPSNVLLLCEILDNDGEVIADCEKSITVYPYNYFTGFYDSPESLAFFVTPHQDIIGKISESIEYTESEKVLDALYQLLKTDKITFVQENYFEYSTKKIRLPEEVILSKIANSLEISLLLASVFEYKKISSKIIVSPRGKVFFYLDDEPCAYPLQKFDIGKINDTSVVIDCQYFAYGSDLNFETALYNSRNSLSFSDEKLLLLNIFEIRNMHIFSLPDRFNDNGAFVLSDDNNRESEVSFDSYYDFLKRFSNDSRVKSILTYKKLNVSSSKLNYTYDRELDINQNKILSKILSNDITLIRARNGSGKTTLFSKAAKYALKNKKSVLYLTDNLNGSDSFVSIMNKYVSSPFILDASSFTDGSVINNKFEGIFKGDQSSFDSINSIAQAYKKADDYYAHIDGDKNIVNSFFIASEKYNQYRDVNDCILFSPIQVGSLSDDLVKEWFNVVSELSNAATEAKTIYKNPLAFIKYSNFTYEYKSKLFSKLEELIHSIDKYTETRNDILQYFSSLGDVLSYNANQTFCDLLRHISGERDFPSQFFIDPARVEENFQTITKIIQLRKDNKVKYDSISMAFEDDILSLDSEETLILWKSANNDRSIKSFSNKRQVIKTVKKYLKPNCEFENIDLVLNSLNEYHANENIIAKLKDNAFRVSGINPDDENSWDLLRERSEFCFQVYSVYRSYFDVDKLSEFACEINNACRIPTFNEKCAEYIEQYDNFNQLKEELQDIVFSDLNSFYSNALAVDADYFCIISQSLNELLLSLDNLKSWCNWLNARQKAIDVGVKNIVSCLENGRLNVNDIVKSFVRGFFKAICENCFINYPDITPESLNFDELNDIIYNNSKLADEATKFEIDALLSIERIDAFNHLQNGKTFYDSIKEDTKEFIRSYPLITAKIDDAKLLDIEGLVFDYVFIDSKSKISLIDILWLFDHSKHIAFAGNLSENNVFDHKFVDLKASAFDYLWKIIDEKYNMSCVYKNSSSMVNYISKFSDAIRKDSRCYSVPCIDSSKPFEFVQIHGFYDVDYEKANLQEALWAIDYIEKFMIGEDNSLNVVCSTAEQSKLVLKLLAKKISESSDYKQMLVDNKKRISVFSVNDEYLTSDITLYLFTFAPDKSLPGAKLPYEIISSFSYYPENVLNALISSAQKKFILCSSIAPQELSFTTSALPTMSYLSLLFDLASKDFFNSSYEIIENQNSNLYIQRLMKDLKENGFEVLQGIKSGRFYIDLAVLDENGNFKLGIISDSTVLNQPNNIYSVEYLNLRSYKEAGWNIFRLRSPNLFDSYERELDNILKALGFDLYSKELQ